MSLESSLTILDELTTHRNSAALPQPCSWYLASAHLLHQVVERRRVERNAIGKRP